MWITRLASSGPQAYSASVTEVHCSADDSGPAARGGDDTHAPPALITVTGVNTGAAVASRVPTERTGLTDSR